MVRFLRHYAPLIALAILTSLPLFLYGISTVVDGPNHFYRLAELVWHFRHGDFYPRWFTDLHYGLGAPVFNFYAPLSYYIPVPFALLGIELPTALTIGYVIAIIVAVFGMNQWVSEQFDSPQAGWVASAAYIFSPYFFYNILIRGAYPETWALAIAPWLFWSAYRLIKVRSPRTHLIFTSLYAALILTHNLSAFLFTPVLSIYAAVLIVQTRQPFKKAISALALGGTHAIGIAAFYLLPFIFESQYINLQRASLNYRDFFIPLQDLFSLPLPFDHLRVNNAFPLALPIPLILLGILALLFWRKNIITLALASTFIAIAFLTQTQSDAIWQTIPIRQLIQFPWRLLGPAMLLLAWLAASAIPNLPAPRFTSFLAIAITLLYGLTWTYQQTRDNIFPTYPSAADVVQYEIKNPIALGTTFQQEFLPRNIQQLSVPDQLLQRYTVNSTPSRLASLPDGVKCQVLNVTVNEEEVKCESSKDFQASFYRFYFPGWVTTLDGKRVETTPTQTNNIAFNVPSGTHTLKVLLQPTLPQFAGTNISLVAGVLLLVIGFKKHHPLKNTKHNSQTNNQLTATIVSLFIVTLFILRLTYFNTTENIFRYTQLNSLPNPISINFGDQIELIGYNLPKPVSSGDTLHFKLFWKPNAPIADDYSVTVQLADHFGNRFGQSDSQHPDLVATTQWRDYQYAHDEHNLPTFIGTPPGEYRLLVSVYSKTKTLNVIRDGALAEVEYELGKVKIEHGATQTAGDLRLVDYSIASRELNAGDALLFTTLWHSGDKPTNGVAATFLFTDSANKQIAVKDFPLSGSDYPPEKWNRNELVRYPQTIIVPPDLNAGTYRVGITLNNGAQFDLGEVKIAVPTRSFVIPAMQKRIDYAFNDTIILLGYDVKNDSIVLYWQSKKIVDKQLTTFVHKLENGAVTAGHDAPPLRPTTSWMAGEVITDIHTLNAGDNFEIGLYDPISSERYGKVFLAQP